MVEITKVDADSLAEKAGILDGDLLVSLNGNAIKDVLDYRFYLACRHLSVEVLRKGEGHTFLIRKREYDDIGLSFETPLMDKKHTCKNGCIFCFIDQMPKGLRETLYFKDDDARLSFLHGNYITLTNLTDEDVNRIIKMRFSPINVSVHTTNPQLRVSMMRNKRAGEVLGYLGRLASAGLTLRAQIVLCRGINDGEELQRTMRDLTAYMPALDSVSVVPAGLTRYREGLYPLEAYSAKECVEIIRQVEGFAAECLEKYGTRLFFAADELYVKAGLPIPKEEAYEEYPQIENGVGLLRSLKEELASALNLLDEEEIAALPPRRVSMATGLAAAKMLSALAEEAMALIPQLQIAVYPIVNEFFGEHITVAGLLTGKDMAAQLKDKPLGEALLIPRASLRSEGDLFLCGMSHEALGEALGVSVLPVENDGFALLDAWLGR